MLHCSDRPGTEYPVIRAILPLVLSALFLMTVVFPVKAEPALDDAEALRSFLETHYGITIRMGDECSSCSPGEYDVRFVPVGLTPFQRIVAGNSRFAGLLRIMDDAFSVYPPEFFSKFSFPSLRGGLRFLLVDEIRRGEMRIGGIQNMSFTDGKDGTFDIWLAPGEANAMVVHHEIWHVMEYRILCSDPHAFDGWADLNPEGFVYTEDESVIRRGEDTLEPDDWFVREYSRIRDTEDRATVFDAMMTKDEAWWSTRPYLQKKAEVLLEKAEPVFGDLFAGE